tara:strand:- start:2481 stop:3149 length:669 start_codon:yes stop_codon:yes gene_type:complete
MARSRFTGQGFTNPIDSLGLNAESRHRAMPPISNAFMSNEAFHAENVKVFNTIRGEIVGEGTEAVVKKTFLNRISFGLIGKGGKRKTVSEIVGEGTEEALEEGVETAAEKAARKKLLDAQTKALLKGTKNPLTNTIVKVGGVVLVAGYGINVLGAPLVENITGANCGEKAIDAGYEEGTDDYSQYVEDCQGDATTKVLMTGVAVLGVVGLIGFILLRPKKSE